MDSFEIGGEGYGRRWTEIAEEMEQRGSFAPPQGLPADRLCAADDPKAAIDAVLDEAAARFRHCILFRIQEGVATVWAARGWVDQTQALISFAAASDSGNPLELLQVHNDFRGNIPIEQAYVPFFERLGLTYPAQISLTPVVVAGRLMAILYCDEGEADPLRGTEAQDRELGTQLELGLTLVLIKNKIRSLRDRSTELA